MDRVWVVISSPDDLLHLKEQLLKPDPNERKPQGQAPPNVLFGAGLAAGRRPVKTVLVRPVGHISRLPLPRRTFCVLRCPGLWHGRRTSPGMWSGRCKHAARRVRRP
jgi:hypothetical protein